MIDHVVPESNHFLRGLDRNERYVLALFYADQLTVPEISLVLDLAEYRVRGILEQLRDRACAMLGLRAAAT